MIRDAVKIIQADTLPELQIAIDHWLDEQYDEVDAVQRGAFRSTVDIGAGSFNIESVQVQATLWPDKQRGSLLCAVIVYSYD